MRLFALPVLLAVAAAAQGQPVPLGRLPAGVTPTAYRLDLTVDPSKPEYQGHAEIDTVFAGPARSLYLHGLGLKVGKATATAGGRTVAATWREVDATGVARLELAGTLPAGKVTLAFDYSTGFRSGAEGLFRAKVGDDWYAWTQMEPIDARRMFPGFDEPGFKTPFTVSITAPSAVIAVANAPEVSATPKGAMTVHRFAPTLPLPTYLVAIGVGPFDVAAAVIPPNATRKAPLEFRVLATKGQKPRMATTIAETPKIVARLEDYFGIPYPYEKLDFIASPVMGGAMENAGLIVYQDSLILLDADAPLNQLRGFGGVVAHELAHQWFGDLVTPGWWTDIWLNESFASWMGDKIAQAWRPELGFAAGTLDDAFGAMDVDSLGRGRPIRQTIERNDQIASAFDGITYQKGAQVVSMFETYVGEATFQKGVRLHLGRHMHGNASAEDFFGAVGEAAGNPAVIPALRSFTDQTGVPLLTATDGSSAISLAQARYRPIGIAAAPDQLWQIPACLSRGEGRACSLVTGRTQTVPPLVGTATALVPNADGAGYYRFAPGATGWGPLIAAAPTLPGREAMVTADSLWADFAGTGSNPVRFSSVVEGAASLATNRERLAAVSLGYKFIGLRDTLLEAGQIPAYRRMMTTIYGPELAKLGFDPRRGAHAGDATDKQARRQSLLPLIAFEARDPAVRAQLSAAGAAAIGGDAGAIDPAFRSAALGVAVEDRGVPFMETLSAALIKSDDPLFRSQAVRALGRAEGPEAVAAAHRLALAPGMQSLETVGVVQALGRQRAARDATVAFANANFTRLMESYPGFARTGIINLYDGYCDTADIARVETALRPKLSTLGGGDLELAQTKERIAQCAALKAAKGAEIADVLAKF